VAEAKDHLHFIPVATRAKDAQFPDHLSNPVRQAGSAIPDFPSFSTHGQGTGGHSSGLYPTDHFGFGNATSCPGREDVVGLDIVRDHTDYLMNVLNGTYDFAALNSLGNEFLTSFFSRHRQTRTGRNQTATTVVTVHFLEDQQLMSRLQVESSSGRPSQRRMK
jgi:hypothetical protein